jgi:hypothetical protein
MSTNNNPFIILSQSSEKKNIDKSFVQALQALLFLNKNNLDTLLSEKYNTEITFDIDQNALKTKWFTEKLTNKEISPLSSESNNYDPFMSRHNSFRTVVPKGRYKSKQGFNIGEFLVSKLSENFRRLYSANRSGGKMPRELGVTPEALLEQQKFIYESLEIIGEHFKFDSEKRIFKNIFFGNSRFLNSSQAFFYLSLHEHLSPDNEDAHLRLLKKSFKIEDIDPSVIKETININYPPQKSAFVNKFISHFSEDFFKDIGAYLQKNTNGGSLICDIFLHCAKNNIEIPYEQKFVILKSILNPGSYLFQQPENRAESIAKVIKLYIPELNKNLNSITSSPILSGLTQQNCASKISLLITDKLTNPEILWQSMNPNVSTHVQSLILGKYDLSDQSIYIDISKKIINLPPSLKNNKMIQFLDKFSSHIKNETMGIIIAMDFTLMDIIQPLYISRKLNQELSPISEQSQPKKMKI